MDCGSGKISCKSPNAGMLKLSGVLYNPHHVMEIRRCVFGQICDNVIDKGLLLNVKYLLFVVHINPQPPTTVSYFNFHAELTKL